VPLLRSLFRLYVCNARVLCIHKGIFPFTLPVCKAYGSVEKENIRNRFPQRVNCYAEGGIKINFNSIQKSISIQIAIFEQYLALARKRYKIGPQLQWRRIETMRSIEWWHHQWPYVTLQGLDILQRQITRKWCFIDTNPSLRTLSTGLLQLTAGWSCWCLSEASPASTERHSSPRVRRSPFQSHHISPCVSTLTAGPSASCLQDYRTCIEVTLRRAFRA